MQAAGSLCGSGNEVVRPQACHSLPSLPSAGRQPRHSGRGALQVVCAKGKGKKMAMQQMSGMPQAPPTPPVDPTNVEFVLFVRPDTTPSWLPISILKGAGPTNQLLKIMEYDFGKQLFGKTLLRQIAEGIYKEREKLENDLRSDKNAPPMLRGCKSFKYAFKVRDKSKPKDWLIPVKEALIPLPEELPPLPLDNLRRFFGSVTA